jgi:hypothetical protein
MMKFAARLRSTRTCPYSPSMTCTERCLAYAEKDDEFTCIRLNADYAKAKSADYSEVLVGIKESLDGIYAILYNKYEQTQG